MPNLINKVEEWIKSTTDGRTKLKDWWRKVESNFTGLSSWISGIGENTLRNLVDERQIAYLPIGNKKLLTVNAVYDWYERSKITVSY